MITGFSIYDLIKMLFVITPVAEHLRKFYFSNGINDFILSFSLKVFNCNYTKKSLGAICVEPNYCSNISWLYRQKEASICCSLARSHWLR